MQPVVKTQRKAEAEEAQRRYFWSLTPRQRRELAVKLNQQARAIYASNPANSLRNPPADGKRVFKSATPIPRQGR